MLGKSTVIKQVFAMCSLAVVVGALAPTSATPAYASTVTVTLDCTDGGLTEGDVFDIAPGDDIEFVVTAGECTVYLPSQLGTWDSLAGAGSDPNYTMGVGTSTVIVDAGGGFTITGEGGSDTAQDFWITGGCPLDGSGRDGDPWLVNSAEDFQKIGKGDEGTWFCSAEGSYLQTANFTLIDYANDVVATEGFVDDFYAFSGTYDGDHYTITLGGDWADESGNEIYGLFDYVLGGTLKKIHLEGSLWTTIDGQWAAGLVSLLEGLSIVSESSVALDMRLFGGELGAAQVVGEMGSGSHVIYTRSAGTITWAPDLPEMASMMTASGLVGKTFNDAEAYAVIADSYSATTYATTATDEDPFDDYTVIGGLVGTVETPTQIYRSYATASFSALVGAGGLGAAYGLIGSDDDADAEVYSSFYLDSLGSFPYAGGFLTPYQGYDADGYPLAVAGSSEMYSITQYVQGSEFGVAPSTNPDFALPNVASDPDDDDYSTDLRWAIEDGNVSVFIPQLYSLDLWLDSRYLYEDVDSPETYQMRGTNLEGSATGYPVLGRVWEICAGQLPTLVWELENCGESGGGSGGSDGDDEDNPYGMSDEEYAEFLASGLTYEQFIAARLAATGVSPALAPLGFGAGALLVALGVLAFGLRRRLTAGR